MWWRRSDGTLVRNLPPTRQVMPYLMRGRNESTVYFAQEISIAKADEFISAWNQANPMLRVDIFHVAVWGLRDALERNPTAHRFVAGGRVYDRKGIWFSYAVKRKLEQGAPFVVVKRRFDTDADFGAMVEGMQAEQAQTLEVEDSTIDKEVRLLMKFPGFIRRLLMAGVRVADRMGMLPRSYIERDPMFASAFFANMASFGMPAVYHHLYEYGTATIFVSIGRPVAEPGSPTSGPDRRRTMTIKYAYDERAEDGLVAWFTCRRVKQILEDPVAHGLVAAPRAAGAVTEVTPESEDTPIASAAVVESSP
ncbi:MAG: hypothetical protein FJW86_10520 [Actinobacteria bacterium]|nr:hypothetical protein [Actinomycetota bacterium]